MTACITDTVSRILQVIPGKSIGKFSLRLVPDQDPKRIEKCVTEHLNKVFAETKSPNKMEVTMLHGDKAWLSDPKHPNFAAAARATEKVYGALPDYTREGGCKYRGHSTNCTLPRFTTTSHSIFDNCLLFF